ncbi:MAG TPA: cysteine--tRNA ligase [Patescibacteria group bacterium]|nr:cysteine--tRNA ligase [Patescibacteria group bacterium]
MMKLHDSLTKDSKDFPPEDGRPVSVYACGPTVYHYAHIGNLRTFLTVDLLRRYLEHRGREVKLVMNITDVGHMLNDADQGEDKMEAAAAKEGKTPEEIAAFYEKAFFADLDALNFRKEGTTFPRATAHIGEMVAMIEKLIAEGKAYVTPKGDVYYSVASFPAYGTLSGNTVENLVAGARVEVKEDKKHPADFALWIHNPNHVMQWKGPQGIQGYPGWHIECSAMAGKYLGETIDLHCGGEDLKFPHHECEIAQSEGANGKPFSRHWLHVTYLVVDGEKMSKSKGNFYTLRDLLDKGYSAAAVRWLLLSAHYRTQLNFTLSGLDAAEKSVAYYRELIARLHAAAGADDASPAPAYAQAFDAAMDEDLNVSKALAVLSDAAKEANRKLDEGSMTPSDAAAAHAFIESALGETFGIDLSANTEDAPEDVKALAGERQAARAAKDWAASDRLRDEIAAKGWVVEDTPQGPKLKKA